MTIPPTVRAFLAGASGSGKSTAAWRHYLERFPRRLLLDFTGEWDNQADALVTNVWELSQALRQLAPRGKWTICASMDEGQIPELVDYLIPVPDLDLSPIRLVHGAVLLVDEVDLIAPPHSVRQEVRTLYRRSRHVGLSIVSTTQRPEAVSREVSSQSYQALCLQLYEPKAMDYMADLMRCDLSGLPAWWAQHPHGGLWRDLRAGRSLWLTENGEFRAPGPTPTRAAAAVPVAEADEELEEPE